MLDQEISALIIELTKLLNQRAAKEGILGNEEKLETTTTLEKPKPKGQPDLTEYRKFVKSVNSKDFMKNFKGTGKRVAQSILYALKKDLKENKDTEIFKQLLDLIDDEACTLKPKRTLDLIADTVREFRSEHTWTDPKMKSTAKLRKLFASPE